MLASRARVRPRAAVRYKVLKREPTLSWAPVDHCGHLLVRDQSCLVASAAPSAKAWSLAHMME